ncbi:MAG: AAA family ATPase [Campylobacterota bacterium]|nr:AAA family ATPase [Campylobacterota bacterium]
MKLIINKFPPITGRCEIDLSKKLTLFVGQNNSGKTYISQLIWGIFDTINLKDLIASTNDNFINQEDINENKKAIKRLHRIVLILDTSLIDRISYIFTTYIKRYKLQSIFKNSIDADFSFSINDAEVKPLFFKHNTFEKFCINKQSDSEKIEILLDDYDKTDYSVEITATLVKTIIENLSTSSSFLPSSRLFFPSFYKYIFNTEKNLKDSMYKNLDKLDENNKKFYAPSYTQPVDELIQKLIFSLDSPQEQTIYLEKLAKIIEGNISVDKSEAIAMADISYNHKSGENIPMYLSSSMVNQLSTLYLYFKYWINKENNFLIIDEPEMNLHPAKKIEVMELLMHFASENKLLMATHSNTLAKSIINYLHLFDLRDKGTDTQAFIEANELEMDSEINLSSNDIGIYYFNGKTIIPYKYDDDSNIHFGTFSEVKELQSIQFESIMNELESNDS